MEYLNALVENQYHTPGLYKDILKRLREQGVDEEKIVLQSGIYKKQE